MLWILLLGCMPVDVCNHLRDIRPFPENRIPTCVKVVKAAEEFGIDPAILTATAWHESRFNNAAVSRAGAVGALQILPKWWCGSQACDYIHVGAFAFTKWRARAARGHRDKLDFWTLAHYSGGNSPGARSFRYAKAVLRTAKLLRRRLRLKCTVPGC